MATENFVKLGPERLSEIDLEGIVDEGRDIRYLGKATRQPSGLYVCLAQVGQSLCRVEVRIEVSEGEVPSDEKNAVASLNVLRDVAHDNARRHGFHDVPRTVGDGLMLIVTEASEAFEAFREGAEPAAFRYEEKVEAYDRSGVPLTTDDGTLITVSIPRKSFSAPGGRLRKPVGVPSELADILIRVLDFSGEHSIDLSRAVDEKMRYNRSRSHKHGGKVL
jgi:NTP pyrophosphatase (non-canonical NTP hydrolase)